MKKAFGKCVGVLFTICFLVCLIAGCETSDLGNEKRENEKRVESPSSNNKNEKQNTDDPAKKTDKPTKPPVKVAYTIKDELIADSDKYTFKIVEATDDPFWGFSLKVYCENKTTDKTMMFSFDDVSVNGYMTEPLFAEEVAPGKRSNETVNFYDLEDLGVTTPEEITFTLRIYDYNNWSADNFLKETYSVYPTGLSKDKVTIPPRKTGSSEQAIVDNDKASFIILESKTDEIWGYIVYCYLENKTDKSLMFSWDNVSVNGFMIDPFWADEVAPGKKAYARITFSESEFEKNNITTVEDIEAVLRIYDSSNWSGKDIYKDKLSFKPKQ